MTLSPNTARTPPDLPQSVARPTTPAARVAAGGFSEGIDMQRKDILDAAAQAVTVDRAATHGNVEDNLNDVAMLWTARLDVNITAAQVAIMLIDLKTVRAWSKPQHVDNWVDMAGYAACGGEVAT